MQELVRASNGKGAVRVYEVTAEERQRLEQDAAAARQRLRMTRGQRARVRRARLARAS